jgi:siderophore synthetase component
MTFTFRPVNSQTDANLLHGWMTEDRARYWGMQTSSVDDVAHAYSSLGAGHTAHLGFSGDTPAFLMERYDPHFDPVGNYYEPSAGDVGMHLLVAPTTTTVPGFTRSAMTAVLDYLFADPLAERIVVEPDVRNEKIQILNTASGFVKSAVIHLPDKDAWLSFCTRAGFAAARADLTPAHLTPAHLTPAHLTPALWAAATRHLLAKAIAEFSHERLLTPTPVGAEFSLTSDDGRTKYRFGATQRALGHWNIQPMSIRRQRQHIDEPLDALEFILEFRRTLGIGDTVLPVYLEEISSTLAGGAYKLAQAGPTSAELVEATVDAATFGQRLERSMTEGHPCFVANNGRLGFGLADYLAYAPETGAPVHLVWVAVTRRTAVFTSSSSLSYDEHLQQELGSETRVRYSAHLEALGLEPADYLFMPVHPWQWDNKITVTFAADIARHDVVYLGVGVDRYQAQQSIRTFFNLDMPQRCYVKTALSVLNMGFMRGLSPQYMEHTPAINDWLQHLVQNDPQLQNVRFAILREVAAVGYHNRYYEAASPVGSPYQKMLSALWRESPLPLLATGERVATMASLLHRDAAGRPLVAALIEQSGLTAADWVSRYLHAYLVPLVHCLYAYELAYMPHGENVILVLADGIPMRILMKDIAEEIVVMGERTPLPESVRRIRVQVPVEEHVLTIFTDVFDCFFRFLSDILADDIGPSGPLLPEDDFWALVAETICAYQAGAPELAAEFARHDLFAPEFPLSCLNRLQLRDNTAMLDLTDPSSSLQRAGSLSNPIARFAPSERQ